MGKYRCASDSLRPGQLDRLVDKIKDHNPQKQIISQINPVLKEKLDETKEWIEFYSYESKYSKYWRELISMHANHYIKLLNELGEV